MIARTRFLETPLDDDASKIACYRFESGPSSLSRKALEKGLRLLIVGADGKGYDVAEWPTSRTFHLDHQTNLLATDNQTAAFAALSPASRVIHARMSWGGYVDGLEEDPELLGTSFAGKRPIEEFVCDIRMTIPGDQRRLFSVVIPTHDRPELALEAAKTVAAQKYRNWELVVFDNASSEPVAERVRALRDDRIRCERSSEFLSVTQSWNRAIDLARGDYVTLIGDDDGLAPGFFERLAALADRFGDPDVVFSSLYQFLHPGVAPWQRAGQVAYSQMGVFFGDRDYPFLLDTQTARKAVCGSLGVRRNFHFNMQAFAVRRDFLDRIRSEGSVFLSPFPDYYLANVALAMADKIVVEPKPLAFQGVSRASFGFSLFNQRLDEGLKVLNYDLAGDTVWQEIAGRLLPGSPYNTNFILTMAYVAKRLGREFPEPDFDRYRKLQILTGLKSQPTLLRWPLSEDGALLWSKLSPREKLWALWASALLKGALRFAGPWRWPLAKLEKDTSPYDFAPAQVIMNIGDYTSTSEVFEALNHGELGSRRPRKPPTIGGVS